ncbi:MAG: WecB/TagA/CpsF family glycosyltransferase [Muribaculaceae bacterium]|nr:WecB/TagA/CpsF family glycosyltransferase [Muribaculaceae bacterium]
MDSVDLRGIRIYPASEPEELIDFAVARKGILVAVNAEKMAKATPALKSLINDNIGYCDGSGVVIAARQAGAMNARKIAGCELWLEIIRRKYTDSTFYIVGGRPDVFAATVKRLGEDFPGIRIVGARDGYFKTDDERMALIDDIAEKRPDFVFVAMGSPKQEFLMADMLKRHKAVYQGLGGSFDVYTGRAKRAPKWWIDHNAEFMYRLLCQPSRIKRDWVRIRFAWWLLFKKF